MLDKRPTATTNPTNKHDISARWFHRRLVARIKAENNVDNGFIF
jgi:hypothetical protein